MPSASSRSFIAFSSSLPVASVHNNLLSKCTATPPRKPRSTSPNRLLPLAVQQQVPPTTSNPPPSPSPPPPTSATLPPWLLGYLKANKQHVDAALETCLDEEVNNYTTKIVSSMRYSLLAGGKRIRPILAIAAYELVAGRSSSPASSPSSPADALENVMATALAVEMIHTMSLMHDDLPSMDDDDFRRGKPTNHKVYGEDIAILAGDALLAFAFETVASRTPSSVPAARVVRVLSMLAQSVGPRGLAGGQVMDLELEGRSDNHNHEDKVNIDALNWIHTHKTATLLRVSCAGGAVVAGATDDEVARIEEFATKVGLAFQIADDVLDVTQSTEVLGKTAGKDVAANKVTFPRLLGIDGSRQRAEVLIQEAKAALAPFGERANTLLALADFIIYRSN